jgi:hypothetical protein
VRNNPGDDELRKLERLAKQGDPEAIEKLERLLQRAGLPTEEAEKALRIKRAQRLRSGLRRIVDQDTGLLPSYAFPGGYPILYLVGGDSICPDCANELVMNEEEKEHLPTSYFIHYEGATEICGCGEAIESAYGDPDEEEDPDDVEEDVEDVEDDEGED